MFCFQKHYSLLRDFNDLTFPKKISKHQKLFFAFLLACRVFECPISVSKMKISNKLLYQITNYLYHFGCLAGLSWQSIEISINYFKYLTVSSIDIRMPGKEEQKSLNLCFEGINMCKLDTFQEILNAYNSSIHGKHAI